MPATLRIRRDKLAEAMVAAGMSQQKHLATAMDMSEPSIHRILKERDIQGKTLARLLAASRTPTSTSCSRSSTSPRSRASAPRSRNSCGPRAPSRWRHEQTTQLGSAHRRHPHHQRPRDRAIGAQFYVDDDGTEHRLIVIDGHAIDISQVGDLSDALNRAVARTHVKARPVAPGRAGTHPSEGKADARQEYRGNPRLPRSGRTLGTPQAVRLSLWSSIHFSDGSSRVSVHVDDRVNPDVAELSGDIWVINAPSTTLRGAIQLAIEHVIEAAPKVSAA
ncbi:hypothetical protein GS532_22615 [Rhodococcus hoagii]|nr:hypothetical protein [Prescottella equi]